MIPSRSVCRHLIVLPLLWVAVYNASTLPHSFQEVTTATFAVLHTKTLSWWKSSSITDRHRHLLPCKQKQKPLNRHHHSQPFVHDNHQSSWLNSINRNNHINNQNNNDFSRSSLQQQRYRRRLADDDNNDADNNNNNNNAAAAADDAVANDDLNDNNNYDDAAAAANDDQSAQGGGNGIHADDYFDDGVQDDIVNAGKNNQIDDFYAYIDDPKPPSLFPITTREWMGYCVAALAITLGASSGIGGGGLITPIYVLIVGLPIKAAIPAGAVTVLGASFASTTFNWTRRHPLADRPIIDWDLILVLEPLSLCGALLGTMLHRVMSEKLLIVVLVLLLSVTAHTTLSKAMRMYQAENRYIRHLKAAQAEPPSGTSAHSFNFGGVVASMDMDEAAAQDDEEEEQQKLYQQQRQAAARLAAQRQMDMEERQQILIQNPDFVTLRSDLMEEEKFAPRSKIMAVLCMYFIVVFLNIMVGGGAYESPWGISCGSVAFWTMHVIMTAFLIACAWAAQTYVVARHEIKEIVRFDYVHGDIRWNAKSAIIYPVVFIVAGLCSGALGIGPGVITVPLMLNMGLHPGVVSATSSAMILLTSFAATSSYWIFGLILKDFAILGLCIGFVCALIGQTIMRFIRQARSASGRTFERNSYTAFVIGGVVLITALLMTLQYVFSIGEEPDEDDGGLCDGLRF